MHVHIVGGFLGSGKTTAIVGAIKLLMAQGKRVGVVTNDKGQYLVDSAFFETATIPTVAVPGGCFRCNYEDFQARLGQLQADARPHIIFAESVGSCVDLVGPVIKPLLNAPGIAVDATTYSVFTDIRLLRRRLLGQELPFSDEIVYIFDKQIEETALLVINKMDLLPEELAKETLALAQAQYPEKSLLLQNSLHTEGTARWVYMLESQATTLQGEILTVDYRQYAKGAAQMSWLDERLTLHVPAGEGRKIVCNLIAAIVAGIRQHQRPVGHLKFFIQTSDTGAKISFLSLEESGWQANIPPLPGTELTLLINVRVQMSATGLRRLIQTTIGQQLTTAQISYSTSETTAFHPRVPPPRNTRRAAR